MFLPPVHRSAPDLGQVFQTLGRLLPILVLCDIIAGTGLADAGQVAVIEDPCLRKTGLQFPDQLCHVPLLGQHAVKCHANRQEIRGTSELSPTVKLIAISSVSAGSANSTASRS